MQTLKRFFHTIWQALTNPSWYRQATKKPFSSGLGYLYWFLVTLSLVWIIPACVMMVVGTPAVRTFVAELQREVPNIYPPELVLTMENGVLSTNVEEPYFIELPEKWERTLGEGKDAPDFEHFITIDTQARVEDYHSYETLILLTHTHLVAPDKNETLRVIAYRDHEELTKERLVFNRALYDQITGVSLPYLSYLPTLYQAFIFILLLLGPFVVAGFTLSAKLIHLLIFSLFVWLMSTLAGRHFTYGQSFRLGLYGVTGPTILKLLMTLSGAAIFFAYTLYFLVWMGVVIAKFPKRK